MSESALIMEGIAMLPEFRGEYSGVVALEKIPEVMAALKSEGFTYLVDIK